MLETIFTNQMTQPAVSKALMEASSGEAWLTEKLASII